MDQRRGLFLSVAFCIVGFSSLETKFFYVALDFVFFCFGPLIFSSYLYYAILLLAVSLLSQVGSVLDAINESDCCLCGFQSLKLYLGECLHITNDSIDFRLSIQATRLQPIP